MHAPGTSPPDNHDIRRYLHDLATVTALPAVWSSWDRGRIAEGMAEIVVSILHLDFAHVRLEGSTAVEAVEAVHFAKPPATPVSAADVGRAVAPPSGGGGTSTAVVTLQHPFGAGPMQAAVTPIGYVSEFGVLA